MKESHSKGYLQCTQKDKRSSRHTYCNEERGEDGGGEVRQLKDTKYDMHTRHYITSIHCTLYNTEEHYV